MIVIASGRYVDGELASELGKLPPAFLPVGNKRLYEHQIDLLQVLDEPAILTLPSDFAVPFFDKLRLDALGVEVHFVDPSLTLGQSIYNVVQHAVMASAPKNMSGVSILFGDTLFSSIPEERNVYSVEISTEFYSWGTVYKTPTCTQFVNGVDTENKDTDILSGWFALSDIDLILEELENTKFDFFDALTNYSKIHSMTAKDVGGWLDFGHVHTYFMSKAKRTTERSFNSIRIKGRVVEKRSLKNNKILSEALWFENIPNSLRLFTPAYLGKSEGSEISYRVEYLYLSTLSELFVHGLLPEKVWSRIFDSCETFLAKAKQRKSEDDLESALSYLLKQKCLDRIELYDFADKFDIDKPIDLNGQIFPPLRAIVDELVSSIQINSSNVNLMHGDFCFSNILYDFRVNDIKVIDPRGTIDDEVVSIFGDGRYDKAKLMHSVIGYYDLIIAGCYKLESLGSNKYELDIYVDPRQKRITDLFLSRQLFQESMYDGSFEIMILLFISMVPLHSEDSKRQLALLLNAYRLYEIRAKRV